MSGAALGVLGLCLVAGLATGVLPVQHAHKKAAWLAEAGLHHPELHHPVELVNLSKRAPILRANSNGDEK